jgi:hypothetical protein
MQILSISVGKALFVHLNLNKPPPIEILFFTPRLITIQINQLFYAGQGQCGLANLAIERHE